MTPIPNCSRRSFLSLIGLAAFPAALARAADDAARPAPTTAPSAVGLTATRLPDNPIVRPDMMPKDDGRWSGDIGFPCLVRAPAWVDRPLGKYYLYFSAHHGTYIRLAYADRVAGPWTVYKPGTLRLSQVETANGLDPSPPPATAPADFDEASEKPVAERHVASPDVHFDPDRRQVRMYFHYWLPKLGHKSSVATSADGLKFDPRPGEIAGPYLRVFRRSGAYYGLDDRGMLLRSPDGLAPFESLSPAVRDAAAAASKSTAAAAHPAFRHGGVAVDGDTLTVFFSRVGDAPERLLATRLSLSGDPAGWRASPPTAVLEPERDWEGAGAELRPSAVTGQTHVRQLRDPFVFHDDGPGGDGRTYLLYAVAGETGIAVAELAGR